MERLQGGVAGDGLGFGLQATGYTLVWVAGYPPSHENNGGHHKATGAIIAIFWPAPPQVWVLSSS